MDKLNWLTKPNIVKRLKEAFSNGYLQLCGNEFIAHKEANEYFCLEDCETELDVKCKVVEWLSRGAHKTCPFNSNLQNERFHNYMLNGINDFLGTDFTEDDIELIYTELGNCVNHELTIKFVNSGYDMTLLAERSGDGKD